MKKKLETRLYCIPDDGECVFDLAQEIYNEVKAIEKQHENNCKIIVKKPDGEEFEIPYKEFDRNRMFDFIRGTIMCNCAESTF